MRRIALAAALGISVGLAGAQGQEPAAPGAPADAPPPAAAAPDPAAEAPAPPPVDLDRVAFEFRVAPEQGGGLIAGRAGEIEASGESEVILSGGVEVRYQDLVFSAERVVLDRRTMTLQAEGDVVLDQGIRRIAAARADFDLASETGTFWSASAFAEPDQYFDGEVLIKTGENTFEVRDGMVTSCKGDATPDWSLRVSRATIELEGYAHLTNTRMRVKKLPIFYLPYLIWPAKTDRASGLLIPTYGYTKTRGASLGVAYYQVMGPSADLTLSLEGYEQTYAGATAELRYQPTEGTRGRMVYQLLSDRDADQAERRVVWSHSTNDLFGGLRGVVTINDYSDYDFYREFLRSEGENTRRYIYSNAFLSGSWGAQSFSLLVDDRETFLGGDRSSHQRQLPELNYKVRKLKLGRAPVYFSLDSTASYLESATDDSFDVRYGRVDVKPQLTVPLKVAPWFSVAVSAGGRGTWWGDSFSRSTVDEVTGETVRVCDDGEAVEAGEVYCGEQLTRAFETVDAAVVGPSFSKVFGKGGTRFSKFKHVIEPRFNYNMVGEFDEQNRVPRFDEIDQLGTREVGSVALVNRVLAKPSDESQGGAFEIFSFEVAQSFSFDRDRPFQRSRDGLLTSRESPISARLRFSPSRTFDLQARASYSTLFSQLESTSLSARMKGERAEFDATWYTNYDAETGEESSDQARFGFGLDVVRNRLRLSGQINYDLQRSEVLQQRYFLNYKSQCWSAVFEVREQVTNSYKARDFRFLLSLKNVGTFLDVNGGDRSESY